MSAPKEWRNYEQVTQYLLDRFKSELGLTRVEGEQSVVGTVTDWNIEVKAVRTTNSGETETILVECRRTKKRQSQEKVGGFAYRIKDAGASGGILVTPVPLQSGGAKIAEAENINSVILDAESTTDEYMLKFLNKIFVGVTDSAPATDSVSGAGTRSRSALGAPEADTPPRAVSRGE